MRGRDVVTVTALLLHELVKKVTLGEQIEVVFVRRFWYVYLTVLDAFSIYSHGSACKTHAIQFQLEAGTIVLSQMLRTYYQSSLCSLNR